MNFQIFVYLALECSLVLALIADLLRGPMLVVLFVPFFGLWLTKKRKLSFNRFFKNILPFVFGLFFLRDIMVAGLLFACVDLVCFIIIYFVFLEAELAKFSRLMVLSLILMIASASILETPLFFLLLALWCFFSITALWLSNIEEGYELKIKSKVILSNAGFMWITVIPLTLSLFFIIPRRAVPLLKPLVPAGTTIGMAGFSERIVLGHYGRIVDNPTVLMRVEIPSAPESGFGNVFVRGTAFDIFDGIKWIRSGEGIRYVEKGTRDFELVKPASKEYKQSMLLQQEVYLEPFGFKTIFSIPDAVMLKVGQSWFMNFHDSFFFIEQQTKVVHYSVYSDFEEHLNYTIKTYNYYNKDAYLQLPNLSGAIKELVYQLTDDFDSAEEKLLAIKQYLQKNYKYTRDIRTRNIEDFLLKVKEGHCEYFASAMVIMARIAGIQTRLVNGFLAKEWNSMGKFYTLRGSYAHAWVEAYIPYKGWVSYDPTPSESGSTASIKQSKLRTWLAFIGMQWRKYILYYDGEMQIEWIGKIKNMLIRLTDSIRIPLEFNFSKILFVTLSVIVVLFLLFRAAPILRKKSKSLTYASVAFYERTLRLLEKYGFKKAVYQTPREFADIVSNKFDGINFITELYYKIRFGMAKLTYEEYQKVHSIINQISNIKTNHRL